MSSNNLPAQFIHEESFDYLASGDQLVTELLSQRQRAIELATSVLGALDELNKLLTRESAITGISYEHLANDVVGPLRHSAYNPLASKKQILKAIDSRFWGQLMERSKLTTLMNTNDKDKMREESATKAPEFTNDAVVGTMRASYENRFNTFVGGLVDLFDSLPVAYKSNDKICIRKKIIFSEAFNGKSWNHHSSARDRVFDLSRIFMILDCQDPTEVKYSESIPSQIDSGMSKGINVMDHGYFKSTVYGNGNLHIEFIRKDLVDGFNEILASAKDGSLGFRSAAR